MEPFFSVLLSALFLGEKATAPVLLTLLPIVGGVAAASVSEVPHPRTPHARARHAPRACRRSIVLCTLLTDRVALVVYCTKSVKMFAFCENGNTCSSCND